MVNHTSGPSAASVMANETLFDTALPPLPTFSLEPTGDVFAWISDFWLSLLLPVAVYWAMSIFFHIIDVLDLFPRYRLHTPDEILRRNHASRFEVARDVVIQQVIQVVTGAALAMTEPPEMHGKAEYDIAVWATRLRLAQRALPALLSLLGLNATAISKNMSASHPLLAGALAGGYYPFLATAEAAAPAFAPWELTAAKLIYHVLIPGLQFFVAVFFLDTWQYFLHRLMHMNRWLYGKLMPNATFILLLYSEGLLLTLSLHQPPSTRDTTASTSLTLTERSTTIPLRAFCWIRWERPSRSRSRA